MSPDRRAVRRTSAAVVSYHERTKHHPNAHARAPGYLDWASQPDPFRRFEGAPLVPLRFPVVTEAPTYDELFVGRPSPEPLDFQSLSQLLYDALALSAWKEARPGERWSLRVNPSSGNLHPTEGYVIVGSQVGLEEGGGIYHYAPYEHALERRVTLEPQEWEALAAPFSHEVLFIGLTSIYWRESWKYGERAFRYCQHDVGHALGTIAVAAAVLGWRAALLAGPSSAELEVLLGCHRQQGVEAEHAECLLAVCPRAVGHRTLSLPPDLIERLRLEPWTERPNRLSRGHRRWPIIDEVAAATRHEGGDAAMWRAEAGGVPGLSMEALRPCAARRLIHQRRSAVAMDGRTALGASDFFALLRRVMPSRDRMPFSVLGWAPRVSLALMVHRVTDLTPGLYLLIRDPDHLQSLRAELSSSFEWCRPPECPGDLPLYLLEAGDARSAAELISCHQAIAADGVFAVAMLAAFDRSLAVGPWMYPRLLWEAGLIGQLLYLEAEAAGVRATGIGCFFDDAMHELLGITNRSWQSLYHFTVGGAVDDPRLRTLHPYLHKSGSE